jgi:hypothetical protein
VTNFRVAIDPANEGVRLRRTADIALGRQSANVLVDGHLAGIWYTPDINPTLRFADLDFEIPALLTAGRDTIRITLDATTSPTAWTAFEYVAYSYVPVARDAGAAGSVNGGGAAGTVAANASHAASSSASSRFSIAEGSKEP